VKMPAAKKHVPIVKKRTSTPSSLPPLRRTIANFAAEKTHPDQLIQLKDRSGVD